MNTAFPARNNLGRIRTDDKKALKVLVIAGPSGGHIFPAIGFLDTLKDRYINNNVETLLVLPESNITGWAGSINYKVNYISISSLKLNLELKNLIAIWKFLKGSLESIFILVRFQPDIVVGFGSLTCIPMIMFAWLFRIKTLIHEQNVIPGRANRLLARFADRVAISFIETHDYFKDCQKKIALTGNPVRKELTRVDKNKALDFFEFNSDKFTLLVMGGSCGSHRINVAFLEAISTLSNKHSLQVIHLAGAGDYDLLKYSYRGLNVNLRLFAFLRFMQYAYSASDLVISRAGATTVAEIIFFALPAIIVPYPHAYRHQLSNAKVLARTGSGLVIQDDELDTDRLRQVIESLLGNPDRLKYMRSCYHNLLRANANDLFVDEIMSLIAA